MTVTGCDFVVVEETWGNLEALRESRGIWGSGGFGGLGGLGIGDLGSKDLIFPLSEFSSNIGQHSMSILQ